MHCRHRDNVATAVAKRNRDLSMVAKENLKVTFEVVYRTVCRTSEKLRPLNCAREGTWKRYHGLQPEFAAVLVRFLHSIDGVWASLFVSQFVDSTALMSHSCQA